MAKEDSKVKISKGKVSDIKILNYTLIQNDRTIKRIEDWRSAIKMAENVYNPRRWQLLNIYDELILDPHLTSVSEKRKLNVLKNEIKFFDVNGKEDETINKIIAMPFFRNMCMDILDKVGWGFTLIFFDHLTLDDAGYHLIPRKHVIPERSLVVKFPYDDEGINFSEDPDNKYVIAAGLKNDFGLINKAAPYVIFKKNVIQDWSTFDEVYGFPFRKFTYDGTDLNVKAQLEKIAKDSGRATWAVLPIEAQLEIIQSTQGTTNSDIFEKLAKYCDDQVSKLFLGNTLTTDAKGGQYKGQVHENGELRVAENDSYFLLSILNTEFIKILENFGFKAKGGSFALEDQESEDLNKRLIIDQFLVGVIPIDEEYFYTKYGIPKPKGEANLIKPPDNKTTEPQPILEPIDVKQSSGLAKIIKSFFVKAPIRG